MVSLQSLRSYHDDLVIIIGSNALLDAERSKESIRRIKDGEVVSLHPKHAIRKLESQIRRDERNMERVSIVLTERGITPNSN